MHAVAEDTPAGVVGDQVVDVLMMALGRSRRSGLFLREQSLLLTHQPQVWAALWAGRLDVTKAGILARALYLVPRLDAEDQQRPGYDGGLSNGSWPPAWPTPPSTPPGSWTGTSNDCSRRSTRARW